MFGTNFGIHTGSIICKINANIMRHDMTQTEQWFLKCEIKYKYLIIFRWQWMENREIIYTNHLYRIINYDWSVTHTSLDIQCRHGMSELCWYPIHSNGWFLKFRFKLLCSILPNEVHYHEIKSDIKTFAQKWVFTRTLYLNALQSS